MKQQLNSLAFTLLVLVVALNAWMYLMQPGMVFFPTRALDATPEQWGLAYEDVRFSTADGMNLHGWYLPREGARGTLLFFHGNAGNISHRGDSIRIFNRLGLNVFIIDYRGYGRSDGSPDETGLYTDARAAWDWLTQERNVPADSIVIFGRSLGGVVAVQLAAEVQAAGLIVESAFSSARDVADEIFPLLSRLVWLRFRFDARRAIADVRFPVLIMHSRHDEIIPYANGKRLFEAAQEPRRFFEMRGDHNSGFLQSQPEYGNALEQFLLQTTAPGE